MSANERYDQEEKEDEETKNLFGSGEWRRGPLLGKGHWGSVHVAAPTEPRAPRFKTFPAFMAVKSSHGPTGRADLENEKSLLRRLSGCPNVIRYLGDEETPDSLHVFLEFASGGTLARLIEDSSPVDEQLARHHTRSVLKGLKRIHDEGYVHRDLKPENILLVRNNHHDRDCDDNDIDGEFGFTAKVADLGLARRARRERERDREREDRLCLKGTMIYLPPEAAKFFVQEQASDVWALGCVVLKMFGGKLPWEGGKIRESEIRRKIVMEKPVLPLGLSKAVRDFLGKCFVTNPWDRATAEELLRHPFVDDNNNRSLFSFMVVDSDRGFNKPMVVSEDLTVSDEKKEESDCSSSSSFSSTSTERTLRAFGGKSLSQLQTVFRRLFSK